MVKRFFHKTKRNSKESSEQSPYHVTTNIFGDVIGSYVLTSGHDIIWNSIPEAKPSASAPDKVLFYQGDHEILDNSGALRSRKTYHNLVRLLSEELRILVFAIPPEGCVVIPPTHFFESQLCRDVMLANADFIEYGVVKLITEYNDLEDYLERKRERYKKAAHYSVYKEAYYSHTNHGIGDLNFQFTSKTSSIGSKALDLWSNSIIERAKIVDYPSDKVEEFRKLVLDTEKPAFLYENVTEHMHTVGISSKDAKILQVREITNRDYLNSYIVQEIFIPKGSRIISEIVLPSTVGQTYNIQAWRRVLEHGHVIEKFFSYDPIEILKIKLTPESAVAISQIREYFSEGKPSDWVVSQLVRHGLWEPFLRNFK